MTQRKDDFSPRTREILAKRAGYRCSKPGCPVETVGADPAGDGVINIGVAAHITAASPGGPRYDPSLTSEERRHQRNGLWLCQNDAKIIDDAPEHYTVEVLHGWKRGAEARSFESILLRGAAHPMVGGPTGPEPEEAEAAASLGLPPESELPLALAAALTAAHDDLVAFRRAIGWPSHVVRLNLRTFDGDAQAFDVSKLAVAIQTFNEVVNIAPPGTGKTITLLQTVHEINTLGHNVAIFLPLGEWSSQSESIIRSVLRRQAFSRLSESELKLLAYHGRMVLVMDGWNELDAASRNRVRNQIRALQRDFPNLGIVISSRRQALDLPVAGRIVEIDALTDEQQLQIARAWCGEEGAALLDHAWRTPGVRELVTIPLYLRALLAHIPGEALPTTKEEVLRLFVAEHERQYDKAAVLRDELLGVHKDLLMALAAAATNAANTAMPEDRARVAVTAVINELVAAGQLQPGLQPTRVLDLLVSHHLLIRAGTDAGALSFQHQQFQEWYASFEVERLMRAAVSGDPRIQTKLRETVLNAYAWEEPILFACERLSRGDESGVATVAAAILEALRIDPMLAAAMIARSEERVWARAREPVMAYAEHWHMDGAVDRALHFMVDTGRPEFAEKVWRALANPQLHANLEIFRSGRRFRPSVLGPEGPARIAALGDEVREMVLAEIAGHSGQDGMELAVGLACTDPSPRLKIRVIDSLLFRRADRYALRVLKTASEEVWSHLAGRGYAMDFSDPEVAARLKQEQQRQIASQPNLLQRLRTVLEHRNQGLASGTDVQHLIESRFFPVQDNEASWAVADAHERYPVEVAAALLHRLVSGYEIPYESERYLLAAGVHSDQGPLANMVLQGLSTDRAVEAAIGMVGPNTVGRLVDRAREMGATLRALDWKPEGAARGNYQSLLELLLKTSLSALIAAVVARAGTEDPGDVALLAELVGRHGGRSKEVPLALDGEQREALNSTLERWTEIVLRSPSSTREQLLHVAWAIGRVASPQMLPLLRRLLDEDLARYGKAREANLRTRGVQRDPDGYTVRTPQYGKAFSAFKGKEVVELLASYLPDADFGVEAARALKRISEREDGHAAEPSFALASRFARIPLRRAEREKRRASKDPSPLADLILEAVKTLSEPDIRPERQAHAVQLATVAFYMPCGDQIALIDRLLGLPPPRMVKLDFLRALAHSGEAIPCESLLEGLRSLLDEAKAKTWLLDQHRFELDGWLELLPFSDRPAATMEALELLAAKLRQPWQLRPLLSALVYAPAAAIETVLFGLARADARILGEHHWTMALDQCGTESSAMQLLELLSQDGVIASGGRDVQMLYRRVASAMRTHDAVRADVYARFPGAGGPFGDLLEHAIAEAPDEAAVEILIQRHAQQGKPFAHGTLYSALRHVALGERTSTDMEGAREVFSVPLTNLRRKLFALTADGTLQSVLATDCLNAIDDIRDRYGVAESEPRHPDIASGRSWPLMHQIPAQPLGR